MKANILFLLIEIVILSSCFSPKTNVESDAQWKIVIDGGSIENIKDISEWVKEVKIIPLGEVEDGYFGEVYKIIKTRNHYIIFDRFVSNKIVVFDTTGKLIKNVVRPGRGPGEAIQVADCWLNNTGNLEFFDSLLKRIYTCNEQYEIIEETATSGFMFSALSRLPRSSNLVGYIGYSGSNHLFKNEYYQLAFCDENLNTIKHTALNYQENLNGISVIQYPHTFQQIDDTLRLSFAFSPFIYDVVEDKGLIKRFQLEYAHTPFPQNYEDEIFKPKINTINSPHFLSKEVCLGYTGFTGEWLETNKYCLISSFDTNYDKFYTLYDKSKNSIIAEAKLFSSLSNSFSELPAFISSLPKDNAFMNIWPGIWVKQIITKEHPMWEYVHNNPESNYLMIVYLN